MSEQTCGNLKKNIDFYGWFFVVLIICVGLLPQLIPWGMFIDGITYATISRNLSIGIGSSCLPCYTDTLWSPFYEQPPLAFILQSIFFRIGGDHYLTEKVYSLFTMLITLFLIHKTWKCLFTGIKKEQFAHLSWLPVLLWLIMPKCIWAYKSNVLENTMCFFCLLSFYLWLKAMFSKQPMLVVVTSFLMALSLVAAVLTKGIPGLFPVVSPFIIAITISCVPKIKSCFCLHNMFCYFRISNLGNYVV